MNLIFIWHLFFTGLKNPIKLNFNKCYSSLNKTNSNVNNNNNSSNNDPGKPNKKPKLDNFISGFVDAEGSFIVSVLKNASLKCGYTVKPVFQISLHEKDKDLLYKIQDGLGGIGQVYDRGINACMYAVFNIKELIKIVEYFDKYPLLTSKRADFELFKKVIEMISCKEHLTIEGIKKIIALKASLNNGLSIDLKKSFSDIIPAIRVKAQISYRDLKPNWVAGFTEGEGCFNVTIYKSETKIGYAVKLVFIISQNNRDDLLIRSLVNFFDCGQVNLLQATSSIQFKVTKFSDITNKIIPFYKEYPLLGGKALDFYKFTRVAELINDKTHLTEEGLEAIRALKADMNKARLIKISKTETSKL